MPPGLKSLPGVEDVTGREGRVGFAPERLELPSLPPSSIPSARPEVQLSVGLSPTTSLGPSVIPAKPVPPAGLKGLSIPPASRQGVPAAATQGPAATSEWLGAKTEALVEPLRDAANLPATDSILPQVLGRRIWRILTDEGGPSGSLMQSAPRSVSGGTPQGPNAVAEAPPDLPWRDLGRASAGEHDAATAATEPGEQGTVPSYTLIESPEAVAASIALTASLGLPPLSPKLLGGVPLVLMEAAGLSLRLSQASWTPAPVTAAAEAAAHDAARLVSGGTADSESPLWAGGSVASKSWDRAWAVSGEVEGLSQSLAYHAVALSLPSNASVLSSGTLRRRAPLRSPLRGIMPGDAAVFSFLPLAGLVLLSRLRD